MTRPFPWLLCALSLALPLASGCGSGDGTGPNPLDCDQVDPTQLSPGQFAVVDASKVTCVRMPAAGAAGAEYLYVAVSAAGTETTGGTTTPYQITGTSEGPPPVATVRPTRPRPLAQVRAQPSPAQEFHDRLRAMEHTLARRSRSATRPSLAAAATTPPALGDQRTFSVLRSADVSGTSPGDYVSVTGTVKFVGKKVAIYLDNAAPVAGGYTQPDIDGIGALFDDQLYPIDTTAFGRESDVNGDGQVLVLLTDRVTRLASCDGGQVVVGFFFAVDLLPDLTGSNDAELFYGLVPDAACNVDRARATDLLPGVFVHEFQHMISYNQHVLTRGGDAEDTWLNEGLSMFAQELGGRQVPDARCTNNDCLNQFANDDFTNSYAYLKDAEDNPLIGPSRPPLPLEAYGAAWMFVRWLGDHFATTQPLATDLTHKLLQTSRTGTANVAAATGESFATLVAEWNLANYTEDLPGFSDLLGYPSWPFRSIYASFNAQRPGEFPTPYPLVTDITDGTYDFSGDLHPGSAKHVVIQQPANDPGIRFKLTAGDGTSALSAAAVPGVALLRIR